MSEEFSQGVEGATAGAQLGQLFGAVGGPIGDAVGLLAGGILEEVLRRNARKPSDWRGRLSAEASWVVLEKSSAPNRPGLWTSDPNTHLGDWTRLQALLVRQTRGLCVKRCIKARRFLLDCLVAKTMSLDLWHKR